jgi:hypothetical protein
MSSHLHHSYIPSHCDAWHLISFPTALLLAKPGNGGLPQTFMLGYPVSNPPHLHLSFEIGCMALNLYIETLTFCLSRAGHVRKDTQLTCMIEAVQELDMPMRRVLFFRPIQKVQVLLTVKYKART